MATMSSIKFNKGPLLEQNDMNINPNYSYNNYKLQNSLHMMQGNATITSQEKYFSNLYTTNQNPMFFSFKERSGKLKWKDIMKLDIDSMIKTNDISPLEAFLENLIFSNVEENDVEIITENTTVKLIKIYQHILEYLLHTQIRLENENKMMDMNYSQLLNDSILKENSLKENKTLISTLKRDKKEKENILQTYKCIIDEYKNGAFANTINYNNSQKNIKMSSSVNPHLNNEKKQYFFCQYCSGKKFSSEENLSNHFQRRHANQRKNETIDRKDKDLDVSDLRQSRREYIKNLEGQVEELKNLFQNFMKNNFNDASLNKLAENQKVLENKISDVKNDKEKMVNLMEENFKKTLIEIKEFVKNNAANNSINKGEQNDQNESLIRQKEGIDSIKDNIHQLNGLITEIKKNQNEKIQNVFDQLNNIKSTFSSEIRDLKITQNSHTEANGYNNMNYQSFSNNKFRGESIEITNAFSISNLPEKINKTKINQETKNIKVVKQIFNAGPLESDYSEDDEKYENDFDKRKKEYLKISPEIRNNNSIKNENTEISEFKKNHIKNKLEKQKLEADKSSIQEVKTEIKDLTGAHVIFSDNKKLLKDPQEKSKEEIELASGDRAVDISNITKEKKKMKIDEAKLKDKSEHEIVMDDFSELSKVNNIKNIKDQDRNIEKEKNNNKINNTNKKNEEIDNIQFKNKNKNIDSKKNEIQIIDFKTNNLENYVLENENLEAIKSKFASQYEERERLFKMAHVDLNNMDLEKDDIDVYKQVL